MFQNLKFLMIITNKHEMYFLTRYTYCQMPTWQTLEFINLRDATCNRAWSRVFISIQIFIEIGQLLEVPNKCDWWPSPHTRISWPWFCLLNVKCRISQLASKTGIDENRTLVGSRINVYILVKYHLYPFVDYIVPWRVRCPFDH